MSQSVLAQADYCDWCVEHFAVDQRVVVVFHSTTYDARDPFDKQEGCVQISFDYKAEEHYHLRCYLGVLLHAYAVKFHKEPIPVEIWEEYSVEAENQEGEEYWSQFYGALPELYIDVKLYMDSKGE